MYFVLWCFFRREKSGREGGGASRGGEEVEREEEGGGGTSPRMISADRSWMRLHRNSISPKLAPFFYTHLTLPTIFRV